MRNPSTKSITVAVALAATLVASVPTQSYAADRRSETRATQSREESNLSPFERFRRMLWEVVALLEPTTTIPKEAPVEPQPDPSLPAWQIEPTTTIPAN